MNYRGRNIDPVRLWDKYVELPHNVSNDEIFLPKVQCPNPNHDTMKRHFQINTRDGLVHCFAHCGISGTYEHAICVIEGLYDKYKVEGATNEQERKRRRQRAWKEARKIILTSGAGKIGGLARNRVAAGKASRNSRADDSARSADALRYATFLPERGRNFLNSRGVQSESVSKWRLGWDATEARLVIPAYDERDVLRFLIKRAVRERDQPKYLYTEGFPKTSLLFGACALDLDLVKSTGLVLVEGSIDTIVNHQNGLTNTGGILGTGISDKQVKIISRLPGLKRIYLMFDRDTAGVVNIEIAARKLRKWPLYIVRFPKGKFDPAELNGKEAVRAIERAVPATKWFRKNYPNANRRKVGNFG
jgi:DNA primase